jgi:N-hydroxyarylamine O-acetyltransferase
MDLEAYFERIGYTGPTDPTLETLQGLHLAHAESIPFENLDIILGRPILLDVEHLEAKLVRDRRGGYCFEQNGLFAAMLQELEFRVTGLAARVRMGVSSPGPRTHRVTIVDLPEGRWLADVGFGGDGLLLPIPLEPGKPAEQFAWTYRLAEEPNLLVLQALHGEAWIDLYAFTMEPQLPIDYILANHYTSTHPQSKFVRFPTVQLPGREVRKILRGHEYIEMRASDSERTIIDGEDTLLGLLEKSFGLLFPPGTSFEHAR